MRPFLICGMPRTAGTWLSVAASMVPNAICYHEPTVEMASWEEVFDLWGSGAHHFVGISDSLLSLHAAAIIDRIKPRVLVVRRPKADVLRSLAGIGVFPPPKCLDIVEERLRDIQDLPGVMQIEYADKTVDIGECLAHLMPGANIDRAKLNELRHINCQEDMVRVHKLAANANLDGLFGADILRKIFRTG